MRLLDEDEILKKKDKEIKVKKFLISAIILLTILCIVIIMYIFYRSYNPDKITTYIDGKKISGFDLMLDFETDENGELQIYIPIKAVAQYFGYKSYDGDWNKSTETNDKCYIQKEKSEVAIYSEDSNIIYKLNLSKNIDEYNYCNIDKKVFMNNNQLYTTIDGIEKGYNVSFAYDKQKKIITIYTLDYLISYYETALKDKSIEIYGTVEIDTDFENYKSVLENELVVKSTEDNKYGVLSIKDNKYIIEPKYDSIKYVPYSSNYIVETNRKKGILSLEGKTQVKAVYDELTLMDRDADLYLIKQGNLYGVINGEEKIIVNAENNQIGLDVSSYSKNGIKNGYILLNTLIPVKKNNLWAFYDVKGKQITNYMYKSIGCSVNSTDKYSLLVIPERNVIVVSQKDKEYTLIDLEGKDIIQEYNGMTFSSLYIKEENGKILYCMVYRDIEHNILDYI